MSRLPLFFAIMCIFANAEEVHDTGYFQNELNCRKHLEQFISKHGYSIYVFCAVPLILAIVQLIVVILFARFVKKKMCTNANLVIEKCHTVMDAVMVSLLPQNVMVELAAPEEKAPKKSKEKKAKDKKGLDVVDN